MSVIPLRARDIWRFSVASHSTRIRYEVVIDLDDDEGFICECPRFVKNPHHHGRVCGHVRDVIAFLLGRV